MSSDDFLSFHLLNIFIFIKLTETRKVIHATTDN